MSRRSGGEMTLTEVFIVQPYSVKQEIVIQYNTNNYLSSPRFLLLVGAKTILVLK